MKRAMAKRDKKNTYLVYGLSIIAFLISYSYISSIYKSYEVNIQERNLYKEIAALEKENNRMEKQLDYITTPSFIEREAKRELDLKKPGETVFIIKDEKNIVRTEKLEEHPPWFHMSNPERWLSYFTKSKESTL